MARNPAHDLLTAPDADNAARQGFVLALKQHLQSFRPHIRALYDSEIKTTPDETAEQIRDGLYRNGTYQAICCIRRIAQQMMWQCIRSPIERNADTLSEKYQYYVSRKNKVGTLTLNPGVEMPESLTRVDVHLQPDGYLRDETDRDVLAGALYEAGGALYSQGQNIGTRENKASVILRYIGKRYPGFRPDRILDIGCSAGASSVPYAEACPHAEIHAVDVSAAMLRYAHARAEAMGATVHFHQMNAVDMAFPDGSFDLVVSHNAMHEMSNETRQKMFAESRRLLRPGGICIHQDIPLRFDRLDEFLQAEYSYDLWFNAEPHWLEFARSDCREMMLRAGFNPEHVGEESLEQSDGSFNWYAVTGIKPA